MAALPSGPDIDPVLRDAVVRGLRTAGAAFALLHGSRVRGTSLPGSDIDIAAWFPADPPQPYDVALPPGVDLLVLNRARWELAGRVALEGVLLYDDDPPARVHWVATTRKIYADEEPRIPGVTPSSRRACAVVDDVRVLRLLPSITDDLAVLRREADTSVERRADPLWLRAVKYTFVTAMEAAIAVDALNDPSDLDDFVRRVSRWLEDQL